MGLKLEYIEGQTPIEEDEKEGLKIKTISTKRDLDEFEQHNIEEAVHWIIGKKLAAQEIFSEQFICQLHKKMFGHVWDWAGKFRQTNKNIGIDKSQVSVALRQLCDDALYWIENQIYNPDEIAIRVKHRIVCIHCFPNGNGRHSRLLADIIIQKVFGGEVFSWGATNLYHADDSRTQYIAAMRLADKGDFGPLMAFSRG
ncbi:MAG: mobile mystery protein B [Flavobacteriales bacterium]|nr:mobile mystery protein B [Flavobacteriales bacterium]